MVLLVLAWGSTFAAVKVGLDSAPPVLFGGLRSILGGAVMVVLALGPVRTPVAARHLAGVRRPHAAQRGAVLQPADAGDPRAALGPRGGADLPPAGAGRRAGGTAARRVPDRPEDRRPAARLRGHRRGQLRAPSAGTRPCSASGTPWWARWSGRSARSPSSGTPDRVDVWWSVAIPFLVGGVVLTAGGRRRRGHPDRLVRRVRRRRSSTPPWSAPRCRGRSGSGWSASGEAGRAASYIFFVPLVSLSIGAVFLHETLGPVAAGGRRAGDPRGLPRQPSSPRCR